MFRKIILAAATAAALGSAALVPTSASAHPMGGGFHFGHFGHFGHWGHWGRWYGGWYGGGDDCYYVINRFGHRVLVCE
jgi:hypothetical protein